MKLTVKLKITRLDPDAPKGEELDQAIESAFEDVNIEGYEASNVMVFREGEKEFSYGDAIKEDLEIAMDIAKNGDAARIRKGFTSSMTPTEHIAYILGMTFDKIKAFEKK